MNAEWSTVLGEDDAPSTPGRIDMSSLQPLRGTGPACDGRRIHEGVGAAHERFGKLHVPFALGGAQMREQIEAGACRPCAGWDTSASMVKRIP
jgi:hypothetical protein